MKLAASGLSADILHSYILRQSECVAYEPGNEFSNDHVNFA